MNHDVAVAAESNGITVVKERNTADYTFPAIEYTIDSERETPALVTIRERLPDGFTPEQVGFHRRHRGQDWQVDGETLVFEAEIESGGSIKTVLGIREQDDERIDAFLDPVNAVEVADAPFTRSASSGRESAQNPSSPRADEAESAESPPESASSEDGPATEIPGSEGSRPAASNPGTSDGDATDPAGEEPGSRSLEARLQHLQTDVADLRAYTDALEAFIDENGTAQALVDRLDAVEARLADLEQTVERQEEAISALETSNSSLADDVDAHDDSLDTHADRLASVESDLQGVDDLAALVDRLDRLEETVEEGEKWRENIRDVLSQ